MLLKRSNNLITLCLTPTNSLFKKSNLENYVLDFLTISLRKIIMFAQTPRICYFNCLSEYVYFFETSFLKIFSKGISKTRATTGNSSGLKFTSPISRL